MTVTSLHRGGAFSALDGRRRRAAVDHSRRAIDLAEELGARCLVLFVGGLADVSKDLAGAREQVRDGIGDLLPHARAASIPLAIEPQHPMFAADRACVSTLDHANDLCDQLGEGLGIVVDVYHVWWDRDLEAQIKRAGGERLLVFQLSDWLVPTRHLMLDRGMMGDGIIDLVQIRKWVEESGYQGFNEIAIITLTRFKVIIVNEIEILSAENWWLRDQDDVVRTCIERYRDVCGAAPDPSDVD